ncbi:MAG: hypothetical protein J6B64_03055 [Bacilli bacterium]|nr:hypothetical protein [Bacilli bacterium]MBO5376360.1 hypothetical protein [Bacilli bacterium]MBP3597611.1 hypothetical protein [Clostridia bacterium]
MIKDILKSFKDGNKLNEHVIDYYIDRCDSDEPEQVLDEMEDLQKYGCISGMVSELIYYDDTNKFFDNYKEEINDLLSETISDTGCSINELFGNKFDIEDPLVLDYNNKNLLAWFGFEETSYKLYEQVQEKIRNNNLDYEY